jgi:hypothetical protein
VANTGIFSRSWYLVRCPVNTERRIKANAEDEKYKPIGMKGRSKETDWLSHYF